MDTRINKKKRINKTEKQTAASEANKPARNAKETTSRKPRYFSEIVEQNSMPSPVRFSNTFENPAKTNDQKKEEAAKEKTPKQTPKKEKTAKQTPKQTPEKTPKKEESPKKTPGSYMKPFTRTPIVEEDEEEDSGDGAFDDPQEAQVEEEEDEEEETLLANKKERDGKLVKMKHTQKPTCPSTKHKNSSFPDEIVALIPGMYPDDAFRVKKISKIVEAVIKSTYERRDLIHHASNMISYATDSVVNQMKGAKYSKDEIASLFGEGVEAKYAYKNIVAVVFSEVNLGKLWFAVLWLNNQITVEPAERLIRPGIFISLEEFGLPKEVYNAFKKEHKEFKGVTAQGRAMSPEIIVESLRFRDTQFTGHWCVTSNMKKEKVVCGLFTSTDPSTKSCYKLMIPGEYVKGICNLSSIPKVDDIPSSSRHRFSWQSYNISEKWKTTIPTANEIADKRRTASEECFLVALRNFFKLVESRILSIAEVSSIKQAKTLIKQVAYLNKKGFKNVSTLENVRFCDACQQIGTGILIVNVGSDELGDIVHASAVYSGCPADNVVDYDVVVKRSLGYTFNN